MNADRPDDRADDDRDLAAGYALGILTDDERARFEALLASDSEARHQVDAFTETVADLALDAPPVVPPSGMKADLMALIATTPQLPAARTDEDEDDDEQPIAPVETPGLRPVITATGGDRAAGGAQAPTGARSDAGRHAGPAEQRAAGRWFTRPAVLLSAAAAVAVLVVGGVTLPPLLEDSRYQSQQMTALEEIRRAPDAQEATGTVASGETATVVWSESIGKSALVVEDMPSLPDDKTYELWYIGESGPVAAGTFDAESGTTVRALEGEMSAGAVIAITVEDEGGSPVPTTDPILAIETA